MQCGHLGVDCGGTAVAYNNNNDDTSLFFDWILGYEQSQYFNQWDPLTQYLMRDENQSLTLAVIRRDLQKGGLYIGRADYEDPTTPGAFIKDMNGYFTNGTDPSGSNFADALLGSYHERWWVIPKSGHTAIAYFRVTNETTLNAFAHPEFFTGGHLTSISGAQPCIDTAIAPLDPWAFSPQTETFQWQETIQC